MATGTPIAERQARVAEISDRVAQLHRNYDGRRMPEAVREEWNQLHAERDEHQAVIEELAVRERALHEAAGNPANHEGEGTGPTFHSRVDPWAQDMPSPLDPGAGAQLRSRAITAVERAIGEVPDAAKQASTRAIENDPDPEARLARYVVETSRAEYVSAIRKWMQDPTSGPHTWTPQERESAVRVKELARSMNLGTGGAGGFLVPYQLDPAILIAGVGSVDPMRAVSRVEQTIFNEARFVTSAQVAASWDPEEQEVSDDSPALLQPAITCRKGATFVPVSIELFEDSTIAQQVGVLFADAKLQLEATAFTLGNGTTEPKGVITAVSAVGGSVIATGSNVLATGDLYANQNALPPRWRGNARFMANLSIINGYRQLPQATGLNYSIINDNATPPTALGWSVHENSSMDSTLTGAAADYLVLSGDFQQYIIADRVGTVLDVIPHLVGANRRPTGQRGFYMHWRVGADAAIPDAFRLSNFNT